MAIDSAGASAARKGRLAFDRQGLAVEITAEQAQDRDRRVGQNGAIAAGGTRESIVDHDRGDGGDKAEGSGEQRFRNARRDHGEVRGVCPGDADEAVHDAPDRAEQADERRDGADGGQNTHAAPNAVHGGCLDPFELPGNALLDPVGGKAA